MLKAAATSGKLVKENNRRESDEAVEAMLAGSLEHQRAAELARETPVLTARTRAPPVAHPTSLLAEGSLVWSQIAPGRPEGGGKSLPVWVA